MKNNAAPKSYTNTILLLSTCILLITGAFVIFSYLVAPFFGARSMSFPPIGVLLCAVFLGCVPLYVFLVHRMQSKIEEAIAREISIDHLTGLYNAPAFQKAVIQWASSTKQTKIGLVVLDVDNFRLVNDLFGHVNGDAMLRCIAERISRFCSQQGICTRLNADLFAVVLSFSAIEQLRWDLDTLVDEMSVAAAIDDYSIHFAPVFSVGVAITERPIHQSEQLSAMIDKANSARKTSKASRVNAVSFFDAQLQERIIHETELENAMEDALQNKEFSLFLQPQYDIDKNTVVGAQTFVRWYHSTQGMISPDEFIPLFEHNGFITHLDLYIFEWSCRLLSYWQQSHFPLIPISVNLSRQHIHNPDLPMQLCEICDRYGVPRQFLTLVLRENDSLSSKDLLLEMMHQLKRYGFRLSIADFGTGSSSLSMLMDMPADEVKLNQRLFQRSLQTRRCHAVLSRIIRLLHHLDMTVMALGIETDEQMLFLRSVGGRLVQGLYFSKPMDIASFNQFYHAHLSRGSDCHLSYISLSQELTPMSEITELFSPPPQNHAPWKPTPNAGKTQSVIRVGQSSVDAAEPHEDITLEDLVNNLTPRTSSAQTQQQLDSEASTE